MQVVGDCFFLSNKVATSVSLPELQVAGHSFLLFNKSATRVNLPKLQQVEGSRFLPNNTSIVELNLPQIPEHEHKIASRNQGGKKTIISADISRLDRKNLLTRIEIQIANKMMEKLNKNVSKQMNIIFLLISFMCNDIICHIRRYLTGYHFNNLEVD